MKVLLVSSSLIPLLSSFLSLGTVDNVTALVHSQSLQKTLRHRIADTSLGFKSRQAPDIEVEGEEDEEGVQRIPVKKIVREWTYDDYTAEGEFSADLFLPDGKIKGCAFFMHGFSQYPIAYRKTLSRAADYANVAIIAVETGLTSGIVLRDVSRKPLSFITDPTWPQFVLQRAVSEDTKQCIQMVLENDESFSEYGITKDLPLGVCGHSMGGGLCFSVAKDIPEIDHLFAMAPYAGVEQFDPTKAIENGRAVKHSMLVAGNWDLIARAGKVAELAAVSNDKSSKTSILVNIQRGLHTGFEDTLSIFNLPILDGLGVFAIVLNLLSAGEFLVLTVLGWIRTNTGQLEGTRVLLEYFLDQMAKNDKITIEGAKEHVDDCLTEKWEDKFDFKYGGSD